jgi:hypothetical protein
MGKSSTQTAKSEPWKEAQPYIKESMQGAQDLYRSGQGFNPYPGSMVVPFSGQTMDALNGMEGIARAGNPNAVAAQGWAGDIMSGKNLDNPNPYFQAGLDRQMGGLSDDVNRGFSMGGRYGSAAHTGALVDQIGGARNNALAQNWATERGLQTQVAGMVPDLYSNLFQPSKMLGQVGTAYEGKQQQEIQDAARLFEGYQNAPFQQVGWFNQLANGMGGLGGTQSQTTPGNPLQTIATIASIFI